MADFEKKWYVAYAWTNSEKRAKLLLENEIALLSEENPQIQEMFGKILVPEKLSARDNGKARSMVMYPGYIFVEVHMTPLTKTIIQNINRISRVADAPLRQFEVQQMLGVEDKATIVEVDFTAEVGEMVDIIDGPFKTMTATISEIDHKTKKLKVSVQMFGRMNNVELDFAQVQKMKNKPEES